MKEYDLERIKECVSMEDICDILGIEKRRIGGLTSVLCPFHDEIWKCLYHERQPDQMFYLRTYCGYL